MSVQTRITTPQKQSSFCIVYIHALFLFPFSERLSPLRALLHLEAARLIVGENILLVETALKCKKHI